MKKVALVVASVLALVPVSACEPTCHDGSSRTHTQHGKAVHEICSNGEWIPAIEKHKK